MIVWGSSTLNIKAKNLGAACKVCETSSVSLSAIQRVFTVYWIPIIPLNKVTQVICQSCGTAYPIDVYAEYLGSRETKFKTPWHSFSGLIIIMLLFIVGYISVFNSHNKIQAFKDSPEVGAYFIFRYDEEEYKSTPYVFAKIEKVTEKNIKIHYSKHAYPKQKMAYEEAKLAKSSGETKALNHNIEELSKDDFNRMIISNFIS